MKRRIFCLLLLLLCPATSFGQDISGKWVGQFDKSTYPLLELDITTIQNKTFTGTLTAHMAGDKYQRYAISGKYDSLKKTIYFKEDSGIAHNVSGFRVLRDYDVTLSAVINEELLSGISKNYATGLFTHSKIDVQFRRWAVIEEPETSTIAIDNSINSLFRTSNIIRTIVVASGSNLHIEITDNARIDNDIVSVFVNGEKVISHKALTHTPLIYNINTATFTGNIDIAMHAENTGAMPPCTATMKLSTADTSHNIELASDYQSNGAVRIVLIN